MAHKIINAPLTIRVDELIPAFEDNSSGMRHYLDCQTGEVIPVLEYDPEEEDLELIEAEPDRFRLIDPVPSQVGYEIMGDFVETLPEGKIRRNLERALKGKKPFRGFKDVLLDYPDIREDWFSFHERAFMALIQDWLEDEGLDITLVPFQSAG